MIWHQGYIARLCRKTHLEACEYSQPLLKVDQSCVLWGGVCHEIKAACET